MKKIFTTLLAAVFAMGMSAAVTPHFGVEFGYDHGLAHLRTSDMYWAGYSWFLDQAKMDGFHVGGNVQLDFMQGQHMPSLVLGLNYQFLGNNVGKNIANTNQWLEYQKAILELAGATGVKASSYTSMHTLQIPIRIQYTYQMTNDWRFFCYTGPQVRLHVSFLNHTKVLGDFNGKTGYDTKSDCISGNTSTNTWASGNKSTATSQDAEGQEVNCFDMSWGFGLGFGWKNMSLAFNYDLGMINIWNKTDVRNVRNAGDRLIVNSDALAVTLGVRIK